MLISGRAGVHRFGVSTARGAGAIRPVAPTPVHHSLRMAPHQLGLDRCLAAASKDEKSWDEIASQAADVAKSAWGKLKDSAASAITSITKRHDDSRAEKPAPRYKEPKVEDLFVPPGSGFLGGLLGRAVGGLVGTAVRGLSKEMERAARDSRNVYDRAASQLRHSAALGERLGSPMTVGPALSQSSSTSSINGVTTRRIVLVVPVEGPLSSGQAQITHAEGGTAAGGNTIVVRLANGESLTIGGGGGSNGGSKKQRYVGEVVDADFVDLPK